MCKEMYGFGSSEESISWEREAEVTHISDGLTTRKELPALDGRESHRESAKIDQFNPSLPLLLPYSNVYNYFYISVNILNTYFRYSSEIHLCVG